MTVYIGGTPTIAGLNTDNLALYELRVISNLMQAQMGNQATDELRILRNDQAFELGQTPPVVPGQ